MEELLTTKVELLHFPVKLCIFMKMGLDTMGNGADQVVSGKKFETRFVLFQSILM